ncbi:hypothetical protein XF35_41440 [Streptomyces platensis subsp. clarensis]|nr:hypothetical protein [Streptomyces platensis subsp. clarensis]
MPILDSLYDREQDQSVLVLSVDTARRLAREDLDACATADTHSHGAMLQAAVTLDYRLRSLLAALDAEDLAGPQDGTQ